MYVCISFFSHLMYLVIVVEVPKRPRGKTRMDKVHARTSDKRVVLQMNERFQAVSDDSKISAELSNFLGTLAKRCVSFTYVSWRDVPKSLKNTMWNYVKVLYPLAVCFSFAFCLSFFYS